MSPWHLKTDGQLSTATYPSHDHAALQAEWYGAPDTHPVWMPDDPPGGGS